MAVVLVLLSMVQANAAYDTRGGYYVSCDTLLMLQGTEREVTLRVTNPDVMRRAFQVDMTLPAGIEAVPYEAQNYVEATNGCSIKSSYSVSRRRLRILATCNSRSWASGVRQAFAKVKVRATNSFDHTGTITFDNMVFMNAAYDVGYYGTSYSVDVKPYYRAESVSLNKTSSTIYIGNNETLTATILPTNASNKVVTWSSSNTDIVAVNQNGLVTPKGVGIADVTATTTDGTYLSASCRFTVRAYVSSLTLNKSSMTLYLNESETLVATVQPGNAYNQTLSWKSSNNNVATVDQYGKVTAMGVGTATITAATTDGSNLSKTCQVTVTQHVTSIMLNKAETVLYLGENETLLATITPNTNNNQTVTWTSSNTNVATVDQNGKVTAKAVGVATITCITNSTNAAGNQLSASCIVEVRTYATSITLNKTQSTLYIGQTEVLTANVQPSTAYDRSVTWSSSNPYVASVEQDGKITAMAVGTTIITATTTDGSNLSAQCAVEIKAYVTGLSLSQNLATMYVGDSLLLQGIFTPVDASNQSLMWKTSNSSIATVSQEGVVTAQATGTATITATTTDGTGLSASCQVNVMPDCYMMADTVKYIRGVENTIVELAVQLKNRMPLSALQFDLTLPSGVSMVMQDGYADVWLDAGRKSRNHAVEVEKQSSNKYRVLVSSPTSNALKGNDGALVYLHLSTNRYGTAGLFNFNFTNIIMATPDEVQYTQSNWNSPLSYEYVVGDADANVVVDVADYVVTANRILNRSTTRYFSDAANVNNDASVNVTDLVGITNIALGKRPTETRRMPAMSHTAPSLSATVQLQPDGNQVLLSLDNEWAAAGMQMDVTLPAGVTVSKAELLGRAAGQQVDVATLADGRVRVLVSSFSASDIAAGGDAILALTLDGSQGGMMTVGDIVVAERDLTTHELAPVSVALSTTGVSDLAASAGVRIWAEGGSVVIESDEAGMAQLVMLNGMTQPLQVQPGRNTYPVAPGYYIVRLAGHTAKLKL